MGTDVIPSTVKLVTHLLLMPKLRMLGAISPLPHMSAWHDV
jgi:hypothetical protein